MERQYFWGQRKKKDKDQPSGNMLRRLSHETDSIHGIASRIATSDTNESTSPLREEEEFDIDTSDDRKYVAYLRITVVAINIEDTPSTEDKPKLALWPYDSNAPVGIELVSFCTSSSQLPKLASLSASVKHKPIHNCEILPVWRQASVIPAQWEIALLRSYTKYDTLLLRIVDLESKIEIGMARIPLSSVAYVHPSMTLGLLRKYPWAANDVNRGHIAVGLKLNSNPFITQVEGEWTALTAGGSLDTSSWEISPQYLFVFSSASSSEETQQRVSIVVHSDIGSRQSLGFYLFQLANTNSSENQKKKFRMLTAHDLSSVAAFDRSIQRRTRVEKEFALSSTGVYVLLVCTRYANCLGSYVLSLHADAPLTLTPLTHPEKSSMLSGSTSVPTTPLVGVSKMEDFDDCFDGDDDGDDFAFSLTPSVNKNNNKNTKKKGNDRKSKELPGLTLPTRGSGGADESVDNIDDIDFDNFDLDDGKKPSATVGLSASKNVNSKDESEDEDWDKEFADEVNSKPSTTNATISNVNMDEDEDEDWDKEFEEEVTQKPSINPTATTSVDNNVESSDEDWDKEFAEDDTKKPTTTATLSPSSTANNNNTLEEEDDDDDWDAIELPTTTQTNTKGKVPELKSVEQLSDQDSWDMSDEEASAGLLTPSPSTSANATATTTPHRSDSAPDTPPPSLQRTKKFSNPSPTLNPKPNEMSDKLFQQLLVHIEQGNTAALDQQRAQWIPYINQYDTQSHTFPLLHAIKSRNREVTVKLLEMSANVNQCDPKSGMTSFLQAAELGDLSIGDVLVQHGCDALQRDTEHQSFVFKAFSRGFIDFLRLDATIRDSPLSVELNWDVTSIMLLLPSSTPTVITTTMYNDTEKSDTEKKDTTNNENTPANSMMTGNQLTKPTNRADDSIIANSSINALSYMHKKHEKIGFGSVRQSQYIEVIEIYCPMKQSYALLQIVMQSDHVLQASILLAEEIKLFADYPKIVRRGFAELLNVLAGLYPRLHSLRELSLDFPVFYGSLKDREFWFARSRPIRPTSATTNSDGDDDTTSTPTPASVNLLQPVADQNLVFFYDYLTHVLVSRFDFMQPEPVNNTHGSTSTSNNNNNNNSSSSMSSFYKSSSFYEISAIYPRARECRSLFSNAYAKILVNIKEFEFRSERSSKKGSKSEIYFVLGLSDKQERTVPQRYALKEQHLVNQQFVLPVTSENDEFYIVMYSKDKTVNSRLLGQYRVQVAQIKVGSESKWFRLEDKGKHIANVFMDFQFAVIDKKRFA